MKNATVTKGICSECKKVVYEFLTEDLQNADFGLTKVIADSIQNHECGAPIDTAEYDALTGKEVDDGQT